VAEAAYHDGVTNMKACDIDSYKEKLRHMIYVDKSESSSVKGM
jgi:hypothetical protein